MRFQDTAPELDWSIFADVLPPDPEAAGEGTAGGVPAHRAPGELASALSDGVRSLWRRLARLF